MLCERYSDDAVSQALLATEDWRPYPTAVQRAPWDGLPDEVRRARIAAGEVVLKFDWPTLPATVFLDFARNGDRTRFQNLSFRRRQVLLDLVLAECVEGEGRFVDAIIDGIWAICEETYWGVPAHLRAQRAGIGLPDAAEPTVDLFAAETASHLAWAVYLLGDRLDEVSPLLRRRVIHEQERRILDPLLSRDDFHWMGFGEGRRVNNWNPWICSNWLTTALLLEQDPILRVAHVTKAMRCLDRFVDPYPRDGGCDEGPSYWGRAGASLFDCLDLLHSVTEGAIDLFDEPLVGEIGRFLHRVHIDGDYYVNFADAPAVVRPDAALVLRYGQAIGDGDMQAMGSWLARRRVSPASIADSAGRALRTLFASAELSATDGQAPQPRDVWLPEIEVMVARDVAGTTDGFFVAAKGGHNEESHNHNDIGEFVLSIDGLPIIVDAGVETYTKKTFGPDRYDIWTMQSAYHNLPTIGGLQQQPGAAFGARQVSHSASDEAAQVQMDLSHAYPPGVLTRWNRMIRLQRGEFLEVVDEYELAEGATGPLEMSLMTACDVVADGDAIGLSSRQLANSSAGSARLQFDLPDATWTTESIELTDSRMQGAWGDRLTRIRFVIDNPARSATLRLRFDRG